ncbi:MAG: hypothetical protein ACRENL_07140 [Candidatus Dormibacteria bacterium]
MTAVGATLTALGMVATIGVVAAAATPQTAPATAALRYLYSQVGSDGSVAGSMGATEDTVISVADNGYDPATLTNASSGASAYDYLSAHASTITTAGGAAKYVLAWLAAGRPHAIDGTALLARLNSPTAAGGYLEPNGAFHNADSTVETANAFSQSLAVLADVAARHVLPANATGWLTCAQRADGGFGYAIHDTAAIPPVSCGDTSSDSNDTAIVLEALGAAGVTSADGAGASYLHGVQQPDGGFGFAAAGPSDPGSDAGAIQALVAIGQDPTGAAWTRSGGGDPMANLEAFADPKGSGGYVFPGKASPDAFTTSAVPQALALKPYGAATNIAAGTAPAPATPTPAPTPSPAAQGSAGITVPSTGASGGPGGTAIPLLLIGLGALLVGASRRARRRAAAR